MSSATTTSSRLAYSSERTVQNNRPLNNRQPKQDTTEPVQRRLQRSIPQMARKTNPAQRALERPKGSGLPKARIPAHLRAGLSSPTDRIQSPASKVVSSLRHKKHPAGLLQPKVLGSVFESMKRDTDKRDSRKE
ncbi:hypothetical protein H4S08_004399 [Coemansia sp. RSA 1365]|nr:hypothetical protein H4S08_004399 [Coemansia sp. RSA 1365]